MPKTGILRPMTECRASSMTPSPPKAISNALRQAVRAVRSNMVEHSAQELSRALEESSREAS